MPKEEGFLVGSSHGAGGASTFASPSLSSERNSPSARLDKSSNCPNSSLELLGANIPIDILNQAFVQLPLVFQMMGLTMIHTMMKLKRVWTHTTHIAYSE